MLIKKEDTLKIENSPSCTVWEYDFPSEELGFAVSLINGRFPEIGKGINHKCNEMYYVLSGEGTIHHETGIYNVKEWDCFLFEKEKRYRVEGNNLRLALPTAPARSLEQYEQVND